MRVRAKVRANVIENGVVSVKMSVSESVNVGMTGMSVNVIVKVNVS